MKRLAVAVVLQLTVFSAYAEPPALVSRGNGRGAIACVACHGADGSGNAAAKYPVLAALPVAYIVKQLEDFKGGGRSNVTMREIAAAMTADEMLLAAKYYSALPRPGAKASAASAQNMERGTALAVNGAWDREIPACFKCHGASGVGVAPSFPPLAGQHASYTAQQLQDWKSGKRKNDPIGLMKAVADRLSDDDIRAVSEYLATLKEGAK